MKKYWPIKPSCNSQILHPKMSLSVSSAFLSRFTLKYYICTYSVYLYILFYVCLDTYALDFSLAFIQCDIVVYFLSVCLSLFIPFPVFDKYKVNPLTYQHDTLVFRGRGSNNMAASQPVVRIPRELIVESSRQLNEVSIEGELCGYVVQCTCAPYNTGKNQSCAVQ